MSISNCTNKQHPLKARSAAPWRLYATAAGLLLWLGLSYLAFTKPAGPWLKGAAVFFVTLHLISGILSWKKHQS